jgi:hypothetical protein
MTPGFDPYRELAFELRGAGLDEETVYGVLLDRANDRGDDAGVVFEVLYGDGSVLGTSDAL